MTTIQVPPQVDLPDTAFHTNTAPIVAKSRSRIALSQLEQQREHQQRPFVPLVLSYAIILLAILG